MFKAAKYGKLSESFEAQKDPYKVFCFYVSQNGIEWIKAVGVRVCYPSDKQFGFRFHLLKQFYALLRIAVLNCANLSLAQIMKNLAHLSRVSLIET